MIIFIESTQFLFLFQGFFSCFALFGLLNWSSKVQSQKSMIPKVLIMSMNVSYVNA